MLIKPPYNCWCRSCSAKKKLEIVRRQASGNRGEAGEDEHHKKKDKKRHKEKKDKDYKEKKDKD
jgi:hypothetical protein